MPQVTSFTIFDLEQALSKMKCKKGADHHSIVIEMIKYGSQKLKNQILVFFNNFLNNHYVEQSWLHTLFSMIPKSGNLKEVHNWRPIALLDIFYKLFARLVYDRLYLVLNNAQCSDQHAYRHSYSIEDPLHVFEMLTSKCNEYDIEFWAASIDLRKVFTIIFSKHYDLKILPKNILYYWSDYTPVKQVKYRRVSFLIYSVVYDRETCWILYYSTLH